VVQGRLFVQCLGPVLFILFVNHISDLFSGDTCVKLFADDVKLYSKVCTNPHSLQEDLKRIVEWSHTWQLPISYSKCFILDLHHSSDVTYTVDNCVLSTVQEFVDLGVTMNNGVKFSKVTVKGHRIANLILKCFLSRDISSLVRAFTTYVRPRLEYCSVDWNPVLKS